MQPSASQRLPSFLPSFPPSQGDDRDEERVGLERCRRQICQAAYISQSYKCPLLRLKAQSVAATRPCAAPSLCPSNENRRPGRRSATDRFRKRASTECQRCLVDYTEVLAQDRPAASRRCRIGQLSPRTCADHSVVRIWEGTADLCSQSLR